MKLLSKIFFLLGIAASGQGLAQTYLSQDEALQLVFKDAKVTKDIYILSEPEKNEVSKKLKIVDNYFEYFRATVDNKITGYAVIANDIGKYEPITYIVGVDGNIKVTAVEIMAYRESHGGEIRSSKFRRQFIGKDHGSEVKIGNQIYNIAGATLSCRAIANGVRRSLAYLNLLKTKKSPISSPPAKTSPKKAEGVSPRDKTKITGAYSNTNPVSPDTIARRSRYLMGTILDVQLEGQRNTAENNEIFHTLFSYVAELEDEFSLFIPTSSVSRLAKHRELLSPSLELQEILLIGKQLHQTSDGKFDITIGALTQLWRRAAQVGRYPSQLEIQEAKSNSGFSNLNITPHSITASRPIKIDLGGIAKGYVLDKLKHKLVSQGVNRALLNFGGQILAIGRWPIKIRVPHGKGFKFLTAHLENESIATSGNYEKSFSIGKESISHIYDPITGEPVITFSGVSVISSHAFLADALSTQIYASGKKLSDWKEVGVLLIDEDGNISTNEIFESRIL